eukprot:2153925-Prymnesium_polylepis.1
MGCGGSKSATAAAKRDLAGGGLPGLGADGVNQHSALAAAGAAGSNVPQKPSTKNENPSVEPAQWGEDWGPRTIEDDLQNVTAAAPRKPSNSFEAKPTETKIAKSERSIRLPVSPAKVGLYSNAGFKPSRGNAKGQRVMTVLTPSPVGSCPR